MNNYTHQDMLDVAEASPAAVARHDKQEWISLFASQAVVEDPVGAAPHHRVNERDTGALDKFYETFIAPNNIVFHVYTDIVTAREVVRDVDIEIMAPSGLTTSVHAYVLYELVEEGGQLKLARLAAHWELLPMIKQVLRQGLAGLRMTTSLGMRMFRVQGIGGMMDYMRASGGIGRRGKKTVREFVKAINEGNTASLTGLFADVSSAVIELPAGKHYLIPALLGDSERIHLTVSELISAGMTTSFRFDISLDGIFRHGVGLFEFTRENGKLDRARFFWKET